jgi:cob(I)alamin adenosyltransferase
MTDARVKGMIQIYTGTGKGKTTAALGLALRAIGHGQRVFIIQFMKGEEKTGELLSAEKLSPSLTIKPVGRDGFIVKDHIDPIDLRYAQQGMDLAREVIKKGAHDILILDEINVAVSFGLLPVQEVLQLLDEKPAEMELVLTGRYAPPELLERADLVTEMKNIKHYYEKGIPHRVSIER